MNQDEIMEIKQTCGAVIRHINTQGLYWIYNEMAKVKINGEWVEFIEYQNIDTQKFYYRLPSDFYGFENVNGA